ncbi:MAG: PQQ-binding-like beta-propeller repeat protein [Candidatus Thorarchaeota archaeon]
MIIHEIWNLKVDEPILGLELGDINNNGQKEIIGYLRTGAIIIVSSVGKLLYKQIIVKNSPIWHLKVHDIDDDGSNELVLGGLDGSLKTYKCTSNYTLKEFWNHKFGSSISGILIDDINNDNLDEIIVHSLDKTLRVLNPKNGEMIWSQIFEGGIGEAAIYINNNSIKEIAVCSNDGTIRVFNGNTGDLLWFKKYGDKIRTITYMNSSKGVLVLCGGDDKNLHIINKNSKEEIKTKQLNNYIWKCISFPDRILNKVIVSSYSFAFFNSTNNRENIKYDSEMICMNENVDILWQIKEFNIETLKIIKIKKDILILAGTTNGDIMCIDGKIGEILWKENVSSCTNMIEFFLEKNLIITCHDNGSLNAYKLYPE